MSVYMAFRFSEASRNVRKLCVEAPPMRLQQQARFFWFWSRRRNFGLSESEYNFCASSFLSLLLQDVPRLMTENCVNVQAFLYQPDNLWSLAPIRNIWQDPSAFFLSIFCGFGFPRFLPLSPGGKFVTSLKYWTWSWACGIHVSCPPYSNLSSLVLSNELICESAHFFSLPLACCGHTWFQFSCLSCTAPRLLGKNVKLSHTMWYALVLLNSLSPVGYFLRKKTDKVIVVIATEHDTWEKQEWMEPKFASIVAVGTRHLSSSNHLVMMSKWSHKNQGAQVVARSRWKRIVAQNLTDISLL